MNFKKTIRTFAITFVLAIAAEPVFAQDLLARQAPVDRRAKKLDSIEVKAFEAKENFETPAAKLYGDEWNNTYAHRETALPDSFVINLRHFCMPTPSRVVTSNFGSRWGRMHKGLDIKVYIGDTIRAAFTGKVRVVGNEPRGYGLYVVIRHNNGLETIYGHLSKQLVHENQEVRVGEPIALGGNTGRSTGSHLHFETRLCGVALNPGIFFDFRNQDVTGDYYVFNRRTYEQDSEEATRERGKIGNGGYTRDLIVGTPGHSEDRGGNIAYGGGEKVYYKVQKGETIASIAEKKNIDAGKIARLNGFRSKNQRVRAGQIIIINIL